MNGCACSTENKVLSLLICLLLFILGILRKICTLVRRYVHQGTVCTSLEKKFAFFKKFI